MGSPLLSLHHNTIVLQANWFRNLRDHLSYQCVNQVVNDQVFIVGHAGQREAVGSS